MDSRTRRGIRKNLHSELARCAEMERTLRGIRTPLRPPAKRRPFVGAWTSDRLDLHAGSRSREPTSSAPFGIRFRSLPVVSPLGLWIRAAADCRTGRPFHARSAPHSAPDHAIPAIVSMGGITALLPSRLIGSERPAKHQRNRSPRCVSTTELDAVMRLITNRSS